MYDSDEVQEQVHCRNPWAIDARTLRFASIAVSCLFVVLRLLDVISARDAAAVNVSGAWLDTEDIPLHSLKPGTTLVMVTFDQPLRPAPVAIKLSSDGSSQILVDLSRLRDHVAIRNATDALEFVRLRTSESNIYCWSEGVIQEITKDDTIDSGRLAPGAARPTRWRPGSSWNFLSGMDARLSPSAFKAGRFTGATVRAKNGGYEIDRWVWVATKGDSSLVEHWRELISPNGTYTRTVLASKKAPKLPDTEWGYQYRA